jgi:hypothetical protein
VIDAVEKEGTGRTGKPYEYLEVTYRSYFQGKPKVDGKKLLKFNTPTEVWMALSSAKKGETYQIGIVKNDAGFLDWVEVSTQTGEISKGEAVAETGTKAAQYAEQDANRQRMIVRQSSLKAAVDVANAGTNDDTDFILELAAKFEDWVMR